MAVETREAPKPADQLVDEGGATISWLAAAWSKQDVCDEWDWLELTPERLGEIWMSCRWTTAEELADPDVLYDLFGDHEMSGCVTDVVYRQAKPNAPGAHLYWTTEP